MEGENSKRDAGKREDSVGTIHHLKEIAAKLRLDRAEKLPVPDPGRADS